MMTIYAYLLVSAAMFGIGTYGLVSKRNMLRMLLSAEVMFNAALLALISLAAPGFPDPGGVLALLAIGLGVADVGVVVSLAVLMMQLKGEVDVYELSKFKE